MRTRTVLLGALAWLGVVAAGSGVTWVVIDAAGQQVLTDAPVAAAPPAGSSAETPAPSPSRGGRAHRSQAPQPTRAAGPTPPASASASSRPAPGPSSGPAGGSTTTEPQPSPGQQPAAGGEQRTWRGAAGTVVARCAGSDVSLVAATPNDGYQVEVGNRGPAEVEVTFKGGAGETQVKARCSAGVPRFSTESESEKESDAVGGRDDGGGDE